MLHPKKALFGAEQEQEEGEVHLNLTPMIDIMTTLLFFLLLGYKSQTAQIEQTKNLQLPGSTAEKGLSITVTVTATLDEIKLQDAHVTMLNNGQLSSKDLDGKMIRPLYERVSRFVNLNPNKRSDSPDWVVLLLADKRLKSDVITKIMRSCAAAGIPNFHFGVIKQ